SHDIRKVRLGRLHQARGQRVHRSLPLTPQCSPRHPLRKVPGPPAEPPGDAEPPLPPLFGRPRRLIAETARRADRLDGTGLSKVGKKIPTGRTTVEGDSWKALQG